MSLPEGLPSFDKWANKLSRAKTRPVYPFQRPTICQLQPTCLPSHMPAIPRGLQPTCLPSHEALPSHNHKAVTGRQICQEPRSRPRRIRQATLQSPSPTLTNIGLGNFERLPRELRVKIWKSLVRHCGLHPTYAVKI